MVRIKDYEVAFLERAKRAIKNSYTVDINTSEGDPAKGAKNLGSNMQPHQSHDAFLKGVVVWVDMVYNSSFMPEFQRYHFNEIVMSTSTMHSIGKMMEADDIDIYTKYVTEETKEQVERLYQLWLNAKASGNKELIYNAYMTLCHNLPRGLELQCSFVTNYLQLKTMVIQRWNHPQKEDWTSFISFCFSLPEFKELCGFDTPEWDWENW